MDRKLGGLILLTLAACGQKPVEYASYEDCILGELGGGQSTIVSEAIIDACRAKFPGPFDDLVPKRQSGRDASPAQMAAAGTPDPQATTFHGVQCVDDCSGHRAGYEWAEEGGITDPAACGGSSASFREGCRIWVDEHPAD